MGLPMASNLMKKSKLPVWGYDVFDARREMFAQTGGVTVDTPREIYAERDVVFFCLPTNAALKDCVEEFISVAPKGSIAVDIGSTSPGVIRSLHAAAKEKGLSLIDSPVSGGEPKAIDGTLAMMCGGNKNIFDDVAPLLQTMGSTVTYMGNSGNGSVAKLANNMIVACNLAALGEAFCFAQKAGLDVKTLFEAIRNGFAGSIAMDVKAPCLIERNFAPSARIDIHQKDLDNAVNLAKEMKVEIPLSHMALDLMNEMIAQGKGDDDHCGIAQIYEQRMKILLGS